MKLKAYHSILIFAILVMSAAFSDNITQMIPPVALK